jgi:hypothetical protein
MPHVERRRSFFLAMIVIALFFLIVAFILLMTPQARASTPTLPQQYTCEDVRRIIAEKGKVAAIAFALDQGLSIRQIWQIRRTCKV